MNKRIKQLAGQALDQAVPQTWTNLTAYDLTKFTEKFAELIVNECADMVAGSSLPDAYSEPVLEEIAEEMREWFGVSK